MLLGVVPFVINVVDTAADRVEAISLGGAIVCSCSSAIPRPIQNRCKTSYIRLISMRRLIEVHFTVMIIARMCSIASDTLVILVTLYNIPFNLKSSICGITSRRSLSSSLSEDGLIYFMALLLLNIAQMVVFLMGTCNDVVITFTYPITSIIISRFILNLHKIAAEQQAHTLSNSPSIPPVESLCGLQSCRGSYLSSVVLELDEMSPDLDTPADCGWTSKYHDEYSPKDDLPAVFKFGGDEYERGV
ncbi:uncharacterized protein B0H18DRAFT_206971 [Fomitopsis serialis]|uniref:uncharacterized protein n=1 Tax=Fomitopsis serialis TaxID=139415 RepID=UPI0020083295|nr:uncharacterized protein B0H18DRAFT_206971 [Neoantrodia serialis]KAH9929318.1 hypothetical protein B0H18DRAFT_206971 [Neoantrodia serialis]